VSEVEEIFKGLCKRFNSAHVKAERAYYFALGPHEEWTVHLTREKCTVHRGRTEEPDVYLEGPAELFLDVWNGRHKIGPVDFLTGRVKCNKPLLLRDFVKAFQPSTQA